MNGFEVHDVLEWAVSSGAERLHVVARLPPVIRRDDRWVRMRWRELDTSDCVEFMNFISSASSQLELEERGGADFRYRFEDRAIFRVAIFKQRGSVGVVLERLDRSRFPENQQSH
jgi:twitching motility protein PilT